MSYLKIGEMATELDRALAEIQDVALGWSDEDHPRKHRWKYLSAMRDWRGAVLDAHCNQEGERRILAELRERLEEHKTNQARLGKETVLGRITQVWADELAEGLRQAEVRYCAERAKKHELARRFSERAARELTALHALWWIGEGGEPVAPARGEERSCLLGAAKRYWGRVHGCAQVLRGEGPEAGFDPARAEWEFAEALAEYTDLQVRADLACGRID